MGCDEMLMRRAEIRSRSCSFHRLRTDQWWPVLLQTGPITISLHLYNLKKGSEWNHEANCLGKEKNTLNTFFTLTGFSSHSWWEATFLTRPPGRASKREHELERLRLFINNEFGVLRGGMLSPGTQSEPTVCPDGLAGFLISPTYLIHKFLIKCHTCISKWHFHIQWHVFGRWRSKVLGRD